MSNWKKRRIHKQSILWPSGSASIACMRFTIDAHYTSRTWAKVTCLACLKKRSNA